MRVHDPREQAGVAFAMSYLGARLEQRLHAWRAQRLAKELQALPLDMTKARQIKRENLRRRLASAAAAHDSAKQRAEACGRYLDRNNIKR